MEKSGKTVVILCTCSGIITEKIEWQQVMESLSSHPSNPVFIVDELACGADNLEHLSERLKVERPDHLVVAACSPREHETTFRKLLESAGINPWLLQMVNVREQVAWVTGSQEQATAKAARLIRGGLDRVQHHIPLTERRIDVSTDVAVIGAGPAGMQAAMTLAKAGRKVYLIEREPFIGGLPVRFEELFPNLECGPCLLEPLMAELLHGPDSNMVQLLTMAELTGVTGFQGNWTVSVQKRRRYINEKLCIGCMICAEVCPAKRFNRWNMAGEIGAVDVPFAGSLPNIPHINAASCLRLKGGDCDRCMAECPVEGAIEFSQAEQQLDINVGAIIVATGARELHSVPALFEGLADLHTAYSFERLLAMNGPTAGRLVKSDGGNPGSLAILHCAGSLDKDEIPYCSGTCCRAGIKYAHISATKLPGINITRLIKEQSVPGVDAALPFHKEHSQTVRYGGFEELELQVTDEGRMILHKPTGQRIPADMILLLRPVVPGEGTGDIAGLLGLETDQAGFLAPLHTISNRCSTTTNGICLAGSCSGPADLPTTFASGLAAAGLALSELVPGRKLVINPQVAVVDATVCAGCRTCLQLCPYRAITWDQQNRVVLISDILCRGCGTCVAACPAGAISGQGFTHRMLDAEIRGVLS